MRNSSLRYIFRSLYRQPLYTVLNLGGMALGLAVALVVALHLNLEFTFDQHWPEHERIYRVNSKLQLPGQPQETYGGTGPTMAEYLQKHYGGDCLIATQIYQQDEQIYFQADSLRDFESDLILTDSSFFKVLGAKFLVGAAEEALQKPSTVVLSRSMALKYFGRIDVRGDSISTSNFSYHIDGVIEDLPENSHHYGKIFLRPRDLESSEQDRRLALWQISRYTLIKLAPETEAADILAGFPDFYQRYMAEAGKLVDASYDIELQPIASLHFAPNDNFDRPGGGQKAYVYGFAGIGLLILVLAVINYINMATARSLRRIREAAMRRVLGASTRDIQRLILLESTVLAFIALWIALVIVEVSTQALGLNQLIGRPLSLDLQQHPFLWWAPIGLALLVGLSSGLLPAASLSRVAPLDAFSQKRGLQRENYWPRKLLVGFQVAVSVGVVITAFFMYKQMAFIKERNLGFQSDQVVLIHVQDSTSLGQMQEVKAALLASNYVSSVSSSPRPAGSGNFRTVFDVEEPSGSLRRMTINFLPVDSTYLETMGIPLLQGQSFAGLPRQEDSLQAFIVNESLVQEMGWSEPIGKSIQFGIDTSGAVMIKGRVVGVCEDFHTQSLHNKVSPLVLIQAQENSNILHLKLANGNVYAALEDLERRWNTIAPMVPLRFSFLRQDLLKLYEDEIRQSRLILYLTLIAVLISILGFVGLASFTTGVRSREIGIHQFLGASRWQVVNLMFKELLWVILAGVLIAIPLSVWITERWLGNFAYRTPLEATIIIFTALFTLIIGYSIVAWHSLAVARRHVTESLNE